MNIYRVEKVTAKLVEAFEKLLPQLSAMLKCPTVNHIERVVGSDNTHLLVAEVDGAIVGMLTLVLVDIPTSRKAWIEDVVTDGEYRGRGIGYALVERAKQVAVEEGACSLNLTSNPSRKAAHALYEKCGFSIYDTTLFRHNILKK